MLCRDWGRFLFEDRLHKRLYLRDVGTGDVRDVDRFEVEDLSVLFRVDLDGILTPSANGSAGLGSEELTPNGSPSRLPMNELSSTTTAPLSNRIKPAAKSSTVNLALS